MPNNNASQHPVDAAATERNNPLGKTRPADPDTIMVARGSGRMIRAQVAISTTDGRTELHVTPGGLTAFGHQHARHCPYGPQRAPGHAERPPIMTAPTLPGGDLRPALAAANPTPSLPAAPSPAASRRRIIVSKDTAASLLAVLRLRSAIKTWLKHSGLPSQGERR